MITFWSDKKAGFHIDDLEAIEKHLLILGVDYKVWIRHGAECGDIVFNNTMSKHEQRILESYTK